MMRHEGQMGCNNNVTTSKLDLYLIIVRPSYVAKGFGGEYGIRKRRTGIVWHVMYCHVLAYVCSFDDTLSELLPGFERGLMHWLLCKVQLYACTALMHEVICYFVGVLKQSKNAKLTMLFLMVSGAFSNRRSNTDIYWMYDTM